MQQRFRASIVSRSRWAREAVYFRATAPAAAPQASAAGVHARLPRAARGAAASTRALSTAAGVEPAELPKDNPLLAFDGPVALLKAPERGRFLVATTGLPAGEVVFTCEPLVACAAPDAVTGPASRNLTLERSCHRCFRAIPAGQPGVPCGEVNCGASYCSAACKAADAAAGHGVYCGYDTALNDFCSAHRMNFPRVAAALLARSLSGGVDFMSLWGAVNALVSTTVSDDPDAFPAAWTQGFELVRGATSPRMSGGVDAFFGSVFNLRTYARLMGTLRLNSFAVACPIAGGAGGGSASRPATSGTAPSALAEAEERAFYGSTGGACGSSSACSSSSEGSAVAASPAAAADSGCCGGSDAAGSHTHFATVETPGGTALYGPLSFVNHDCEPSCDVVMGPGGIAALRTRKPVPAGGELTITYLDSSLPVHDRRKKLWHGYGFECRCATCTAQLAAAAAVAGGK